MTTLEYQRVLVIGGGFAGMPRRCRMVVENSGRLCHIEIEEGSMNEHAQIMRDSGIGPAYLIPKETSQ
jgi:hypothetical protein